MFSQAYAMAPRPEGQEGGASAFYSFAPILAIFVIFYLLLIRPQKKKELQHRRYVESLKKGDDVVTQSGIFGRVSGVAEKVVTLEIAPNVKIKVARGTVAGPALPVETEK